jgi:transposase
MGSMLRNLESTGVYWKPVRNLLEGQFEVLLMNAQHIKALLRSVNYAI